MLKRYQRCHFTELWSLENKYNTWLKVELAILKAQSEAGIVPKEAYLVIAEKAQINVERILEIEDEVKHDLIAFVSYIEEVCGPLARYFHYGLTSSDIVDTAFALNLTEALDYIIEDLSIFIETLKEKSFAYKDTLIIGRSHGIHAEPTSFGLKMAMFYAEFKRHHKRLKAARQAIAVGKLSGPVGNFSSNSISPKLEEIALSYLGLTADPVSSQIVQRDRHAEYFSALAQLAGSIEKLAVEIRHLARTEIREVEEPFGKGQKGSSAMPHKKNPILTENLTGLARVVRSNSIAALENVALWHERDISHSSVERIIAPDSTSLVDFMLNRLSGLIKDLVVHPENMLSNLERSNGLYNSQEILLKLCEKGLKRVEAYALVQRNALQAYNNGLSFKQLILDDHDILKYLLPTEIESIFCYDRFIKNIDAIFNRVFA